MKKFLSILLSVMIIISVSLFSASGANPVNLKLVSETDTVYAGDEFVVKLNISDNSKMSGAAIDVNYDKSKLEYVSGTYGGILDSSAIMSIKDIEGSKGKVRFTYLSQSSEVTSAGVLVTLKFKALENASGNAELSVSVENPGDFISLDLTRISFTVENAKVKILNSVSETESIEESESESESETLAESTEKITDEDAENNDKSENTDNTKWVFIAMIVAGVVILVSVFYISKSSKQKKKRKK